MNSVATMYNLVKGKNANRLRAVDGLVILLRVADVPDGKSPLEYLKEEWDISQEFSVT